MAFCAVFRLVLFFLEIGLLLGHPSIHSTQVQKKEPDEVEFHTLIKGKGTRFEGKIRINIAKNTVILNVPAHNDVDESDVLYDFNSNLTITRLPELGICHVEPLPLGIYWSPKPTKLKDDIKEVLANKLKNQPRRGITSMSSDRVIYDLLQPKDLGETVAKFCDGLTVYSSRKMNEDDVIVEEQQSVNESEEENGKEKSLRKKRSIPSIALCQSIFTYNLNCPALGNFGLVCKFTTGTSVHWVTCKVRGYQFSWYGLAGCDKIHKWDMVHCCNPTC